MPTDDWLIFAYVMLVSSVVFCAILPMIFRLITARRRFHRYELERQAIEYSSSYTLFSPQSIDLNDDIPRTTMEQIPYIDEDSSNC